MADHGASVEILGDVGGHPVAMRQGNLLAVSFHPELSGDSRLHELLLAINGSSVVSRKITDSRARPRGKKKKKKINDVLGAVEV